ncbi:spermidine synthase [Catenovulum agarivorans DS-2]|uniref:Polyamine aminopropyltransferase n=1 Tax=Catenovulum agarivorans DS-2 TaxID=1328313 RepID=W7QKZ6_9ALTE|nr:fused MFS/spermidine synthase [Catenovulum agarivorans]EWH08783.1 spermidine synthase [Catenovulum agarivorans DS-2]
MQFSSIDEYRYHESLIHPAMQRLTNPQSILILGGGDGLAARELLTYSKVKSITVVDLDPAVAELAKNNVYLTQLNKQSFFSNKVQIQHKDAFVYLTETTNVFDLIVVDLPDPKTVSLARLYSKQFYQIAKRRLTNNGILVTQATSPFFATDAFWSIHNTVLASGYQQVTPYHVDVPSFGDWGFVMACKSTCPLVDKTLPPTRFYSTQLESALMLFSVDIANRASKVSSLDKPHVLYYYLEGWKYWS